MTDSAQLPDSRIWFVRAERDNVLANHFLEQGIVSMGWGIGPIRHNDSTGEIIGRLAARFPHEKDGTLQAWAGEIRRFNREMEIGDAVATYEAQGRMCHIGIIRSLLVPFDIGNFHEYENDYAHRVEWLYQVSRDILSEYTRRRLGIPLTLHRLSPEASAELRGHCSG